jgi:glycerol-3-phosphate acyltransferase PlsY
MAASTCIILGHNYPFWLGFKGGRGLATGTGIFLILNYYIVAAWCIVWVIGFAIKRNVLISNAIATFLIPFYIFLVIKFEWLIVTWGLSSFSIFYFSLFSILTTLIIISKHLEIFKKNNS